MISGFLGLVGIGWFVEAFLGSLLLVDAYFYVTLLFRGPPFSSLLLLLGAGGGGGGSTIRRWVTQPLDKSVTL